MNIINDDTNNTINQNASTKENVDDNISNAEIDIDHHDDEHDLNTDTEHKLNEAQTDISIEDLYMHNWHIGAYTKYRNKHMSNYVYESKNDVDIIDLAKAKVMLNKTLTYLRNSVMKGKKVLFVGTSNHTSKAVAEHAERCGQYYISKKWFGGLLTNWQTFSDSIKKMNELHKMIEDNELPPMTKKERLATIRKVKKHRSFMYGVKDMDSVPNIVVIVSPKEKTAISEAQKMRSLPVTSILLSDTDTNPSDINIVVPGNTGSIKTVNYFCMLCANACLQGLIDEEHMMQTRQEQATDNESGHAHTTDDNNAEHKKRVYTPGTRSRKPFTQRDHTATKPRYGANKSYTNAVNTPEKENNINTDQTTQS